MTIDELILMKSDKVRRDSSLMVFYIESFEGVFGYKPNCAGCTIDTDFRKFVNAVKGGINVIKTINVMGSFKLKKVNNNILRYKDESGRIIRKYDNRLTLEFVDGFLSNGTPEEIEERKQLFEVLPEAITTDLKNVTQTQEESFNTDAVNDIEVKDAIEVKEFTTVPKTVKAKNKKQFSKKK